MFYMMLVFVHLLAASMALGAIVATDLRMLSRLAHDRVRIPPPNDFVARLVTIALLMLYATGACMLWIGMHAQPDFLSPKLQGKIVLVLLLTFNAVVLHRLTFPRLARGRSLVRWRFVDWLVVVLPVALSNSLWMFCAFLGIARPWNTTMSVPAILEVAAALYALALVAVTLLLVVAARPSPKDRPDNFLGTLKRTLASVGSLGKDSDLPHDTHRMRTLPPTRRSAHRSAAAANAPHLAPQAALRTIDGTVARRRA